MSKKGFTLVELLAVIAILGVVMSIGLVSVSSVRRKANDGMFRDKLDFVIAGAKAWGEDNRDSLYADADKTMVKNVGFLITNGYIDTDEKYDSNPALIYDNNKTPINKLNVKISIKYNRVYACIEKEAAKSQVTDNINSIPWDNFEGGDWFCS